MTTIQVSKTTKQMLEILKKKEGAETFDDLLAKMLKEKSKAEKSMFGKIKLSPWSKGDRMRFHEH